MSMWFVTSAASQSPPPTHGAPLANVEGIAISTDDVAAIMTSRPRAFQDSSDETRQLALETLAAETALEAQLTARGVEFSSDVSAALLDARRQIIFQSYTQSRFTPVEPTSEEITAFVKENAHLFEGRSEYRFLRMVVRAREPQELEIAKQSLSEVNANPEVSEGDLDAFFYELAGQEIPISRQLFWNGSEALDPDTRARVERMHADGIAIDVSEGNETLDVIRLFETRAAPVSPDLLRPQIVARIQATKFQEHQTNLIKELSGPYLLAATEPDDADVEVMSSEPPATSAAPMRTPRFNLNSAMLVTLGLLGFTGSLSPILAVQWVRAASDLAKEATEISSRTPQLDRKKRALPTVIVCLAFLAGAAGLSVYSLPSELSLARAGVLLAGGAVIGLLFGAIYSTSNPINKVRPTVYGRAFLWSSGVHLAVAAVMIAI